MWERPTLPASIGTRASARALALLLLFSKSVTLSKFKIDDAKECVCVCVCVCVCLASDSSETVEFIKLGTVSASDMGMHQVLIILTLTFIQGHTDLNHENTNCLIISETVQAMPITLALTNGL